ncbi:unnamed protein product [Zymoseptoria tritici ST99CH_3D7]|uniref:Metallo-beta-lactamase domain-containing protein n=1 Tax=Zymoseptoria tritici (strain ST99CH_3D7) TaxID=1276538 RepID=A0A1X7RD49_ZYMT9|nr:unnamed protein product [Zymoseptoria tritici ST99CH_3D7]
MSSAALEELTSSSFSVKRINSTTFVIREDDAFGEHPFIYAKLHPTAPVVILSDTGCDEPSEKRQHAKYTQLRGYLEACPLAILGNRPLNPGGYREYVIISTHCHYDHLGGVTQFLVGGAASILASAAGKQFIESDLETHGLFKYIGKPVPYFQVTHWAGSFERLIWPLPCYEGVTRNIKPVDLGVTIIHTPGHTPDSLAWYDHGEMHLYVGDSLYEPGEVDDMPIEWPTDGNLVDWYYSIQKLLQFVHSQNAGAEVNVSEDDSLDGWTHISRRVKLGAGHQTASVDAEEILRKVMDVWWRTLRGEVPVVNKRVLRGEAYFTWRRKERKEEMYFMAPARLIEDARKFFAGGELG